MWRGIVLLWVAATIGQRAGFYSSTADFAS
jgi:hypothetical protein